jgi:hypothetical protein
LAMHPQILEQYRIEIYLPRILSYSPGFYIIAS